MLCPERRYTSLFVLCAVFAVAGLVFAVPTAGGKKRSSAMGGGEGSREPQAETRDREAASKAKAEARDRGAASAAKAEAREREAASEAKAATGGSGKARRMPRLSDLIERKALPVSIVAALIYLGYGAVITYLNSFAMEAGLTDAAGVFFIVYAVAMFVVRPFSGKAFDRIGPLPVMTVGLAAFAVGIALLSQSTTGAMLLASAFLIGAGVGAVQPSGLTIAVRKSLESRLDVANSTYFIFLDVAVGICPLVVGWMIPLVGYRGLYVAMAVVAVAALVLYVVFNRRRIA